MIFSRSTQESLNKLSPLKYSIAVFALTPLCFLLFILTGTLLMVLWPLVPIAAFFQKKESDKKTKIKRPTLINLLKKDEPSPWF
jgi:hypothetical protein